MTSLNEKRVVPTPKYVPLRWLSAIAAVFVLALSVWSAGHLHPQEGQNAIAPVVNTTANTTPAIAADTTPATAVQASSSVVSFDGGSTTLTTLAESFGIDPTDSTTTTIRNTWRPTDATTGRVPPFLTTTSTLSAPTTTTTTAPTTTTTAVPTTTTTKKTTTTTAAPTYPAAWDASSVYYTDDGRVFEEVEWTYKPYWSDTYSYSPIIALTFHITETCLYNIPLSECIVVTGFDAPTTNGYYRIPPAIDGKVVIGVSMDGNVAGACHFNDPDIAPTVKCITFPTEMLFLSKSTIDQCTNLERLYFDCCKLYMDPKALPQTGDYNTNWSDLLRLYGSPLMLYDYDPNTQWRFRNYCEYNYDKDSGVYNRGYHIRYYNVCHYYTDDLHYMDQLYPT